MSEELDDCGGGGAFGEQELWRRGIAYSTDLALKYEELPIPSPL